jgi:ketosteroid isomerase-like protein
MRKMKTQIFLIGCMAIAGCNPQEKKIAHRLVSIDSLRALHLSGWNNKDSTAIVNTLADNAIVFNDSVIHSGIKNIARNWISGGVKVLSNLKTTSLIKDVNDSIAYDGGTYTLDLTIPGGPVLHEKGNYSLIWKNTDNGWKLTLIHIEEVSRAAEKN